MPKESEKKPDLGVVMAHAMLQVTHMVGAKDAHEKLKAALHDHDPEMVPEAFRDAPEPDGDEQPE